MSCRFASLGFLKRIAKHFLSYQDELRCILAAFAGDVRAHRPGGGRLSWPPFLLPGAPLRTRAQRRLRGKTLAAIPGDEGQQPGRGMSRYLGHALVLSLALLVTVGGNIGRTATGWDSLALDRAAELPSAFAHPNDRTDDDVLLKPLSPVTQLVNRPRQGIASYRVREGDTVAAIADKNEISVPTVLWANGLSDDDVLTPGRQLIILPVSGVLHTVQQGEQVADIARRYQSDGQAIIEFNQLTDPEHIVPNEVLVVPGGRREERPRPVPAARGNARPLVEDVGPATASTAAPRQPLRLSSYTVAEGDNLNIIANKFGVSAETLAWANGLQDAPEHLAVAQTLTILPVSGAVHTVAEGDSLLQIADRYGVETDPIVSANGLTSADTLAVGQKLIVPGARLSSAVATKPRAASGLKYTIVEGDNINALAERYDVNASAIIQANGLASAHWLQIGEELFIPGARVAVIAAAPARSTAPAPKPAAPAPKPAPAPPPAATGGGNRIVGIASQYLGYDYYWGGHSPNTGFDCSGFVWYVYQKAGINIPLHDLWGQLQAGPRISQGNLQPGDIVFFQNTYRWGLSHNGIYIGGGRFINAQDYGEGVRVASIYEGYWAARYFGASRPW